MDKKMHLHFAILARLNNEGILKDLHFDRMPLARKAMICNKAMNLPRIRWRTTIGASLLGRKRLPPAKRSLPSQLQCYIFNITTKEIEK